MGRILGPNVRNVLSIFDPVSGKKLGLYYRLPTSSERIAYESAQFSFENGMAKKNRTAEARQEYGLMILEGFTKGSFHFSQEDGSLKDYSSDPADPDYIPEWKEKIKDQAIDLVEILAHRIFEGYLVISDQEDERKNSSETSRESLASMSATKARKKNAG